MAFRHQKLAPIIMGESLALADGDFCTNGEVKPFKVLPEVWLSTMGETSDPSLAGKNATFSK